MFRSLIPRQERLPASFFGFENEMENLMKNFFGNGEEGWGVKAFSPSLNVSETETSYEISAELPGLKPEEVHVELKEGALWITGEKKEESEEKGKTFHRVERRFGEFRRVVPIPAYVKEGEVEAKFENGVLSIHVPKSEEVKPKKIHVTT